jgi:hypothetical protein
MAYFINDHFTTLLPHMQLGTCSNVQAALNYLHKVFKNLFPNINMMPEANKEIKDIVRSLKWKSSQGYDEIPQNILKLSLPFILSPLTYMCNKLWRLRPLRSVLSPTAWSAARLLAVDTGTDSRQWKVKPRKSWRTHATRRVYT